MKKKKFIPMTGSEQKVVEEYLSYLGQRRNDSNDTPVYVYPCEIDMIIKYIDTLKYDIKVRNIKNANQRKIIRDFTGKVKK